MSAFQRPSPWRPDRASRGLNRRRCQSRPYGAGSSRCADQPAMNSTAPRFITSLMHGLLSLLAMPATPTHERRIRRRYRLVNKTHWQHSIVLGGLLGSGCLHAATRYGSRGLRRRRICGNRNAVTVSATPGLPALGTVSPYRSGNGVAYASTAGVISTIPVQVRQQRLADRHASGCATDRDT